jgi:hypothetical protein
MNMKSLDRQPTTCDGEGNRPCETVVKSALPISDETVRPIKDSSRRSTEFQAKCVSDENGNYMAQRSVRHVGVVGEIHKVGSVNRKVNDNVFHRTSTRSSSNIMLREDRRRNPTILTRN